MIAISILKCRTKCRKAVPLWQYWCHIVFFVVSKEALVNLLIHKNGNLYHYYLDRFSSPALPNDECIMLLEVWLLPKIPISKSSNFLWRQKLSICSHHHRTTSLGSDYFLCCVPFQKKQQCLWNEAWNVAHSHKKFKNYQLLLPLPLGSLVFKFCVGHQ